MKAVFALVFLLVVVLAMVQAGVHHYRIDSNGNRVPDDGQGHGHGHRGGSIFDTAASVINGII